MWRRPNRPSRDLPLDHCRFWPWPEMRTPFGLLIRLTVLAQASLGECSLSHFFKAPSTFVCHPSPVDLKASRTSGDKRMLMAIFGGRFPRPRCPGFRLAANAAVTAATPPPCVTTAPFQNLATDATSFGSYGVSGSFTASGAAAIACSTCLEVNLREEVVRFMLCCSPQRDDVHVVTSLGAGHVDDAPVQQAQEVDPHFPVGDAIVFLRDDRPVEDSFAANEVNLVVLRLRRRFGSSQVGMCLVYPQKAQFRPLSSVVPHSCIATVQPQDTGQGLPRQTARCPEGPGPAAAGGAARGLGR